jgi:hypothetical protein
MTVIAFPPRGPFRVVITREDNAWLVVARSHGWLFGDAPAAFREARALAHAWGVSIEVRP